MMRTAADLTLAIHPMRTPPTPQNIPIHPLSRRYQPDHVAPAGPPSQPQQPELYAKTQGERNANTVRSDVDDEANEAKDTTTTTATTTTNNIQQPLTQKIQPIRSATERLKWKFLGW